MNKGVKRCIAILLAGFLLGGCTPLEEQGQTTQSTQATQEYLPTQTTAETTLPVETTEETVPQDTEQTQPPTTEQTQPLETEPPATEPPATEPAVTEPPATEPPATEPPETTEGETANNPAMENETQAMAQSGGAYTGKTEAPGIRVKSGGGAQIDYSNASDGYVMVRHAQDPGQRLKVQVKGPSTTYTYNLAPGGWTAYPLSDQTGQYQITVYINVVDSKYAAVVSLTTNVAFANDFAPFLHSNQYVNFAAAPNTVAKAGALTGGLGTPLEKVAAVYDFVVGHLTYDHALAATVTSGYLPDLDAVLAKGSGICFDYASLMTGMLRSQGIPAKLVIGYAGDVYHAWINVWSESEGWINGVIHFDGFSWKRMDPTFASSGNEGASVEYTAKYIY